MSTTKSSKANIILTNFDFNAKDVELIHRQFSGRRSDFIRGIDDNLRSWAMSSNANPNINFIYCLDSVVIGGKADKRNQTYLADHAKIEFNLISDVFDLPAASETSHILENPADIIKVYDLAFAKIRSTAPAWCVASYFSLREVIARLATVVTHAYTIDGGYLFIAIKDGNDRYHVNLLLTHFVQSEEVVQ